VRFKIVNIVFLLIVLSACKQYQTKAVNTQKTYSESFSLVYSDIDLGSFSKEEHFRGLYSAGTKFFIAGSKGTFIQYDLSNKTLIKDSILGKPHFRDIYYNAGSLYLMSIQNPASLIMIKDKVGAIETVNHDSLAFFDGIDFWKNGNGILFGDPLNSFPFIIQLNSNQTYVRVDSSQIPKLIPGEAGFAASGTSVVCKGDGIGFIGWGGDEVRVFKTKDYGNNWEVQETPMPKHQNGTGIYSMAFKDDLNGVAVGGNWEFQDSDSSKIYTTNGGESWHLSDGLQGYRSCVTYVKDNIYVSTGTNGTDISINGGKTWQLLDTLGFNAIQFSKNSDNGIKGMAVGNYGLIKIIELKLK
jgi:hypothetical protein